MSRVACALVVVVGSVVVASAASVGDLAPAARAALEPAITAAVADFNAAEDVRRVQPEVQTTGSASDPSMLRAAYRKAGTQHDVIAVEPGPAVVVRVRATEFEKRVTNVNGGDLRAALVKAPWKQTPRGYLIDFRLRWTGETWTAAGTPVEHPTLGVVGRPALDDVLERAAPTMR